MISILNHIGSCTSFPKYDMFTTTRASELWESEEFTGDWDEVEKSSISPEHYESFINTILVVEERFARMPLEHSMFTTNNHLVLTIQRHDHSSNYIFEILK